MSPSSDESDEMLLNRIRVALADPAKRAQVRAMFGGEAPTGMGRLGSTLSSVGRSMAGTQGIGGAAGAGLGAGLGLVLRGLRGTRPAARQLGQTNPVQPAPTPEIEPNAIAPAGQIVPPKDDDNPPMFRSGGRARFADKDAIEKKAKVPVISTTIVIAKKPKKDEKPGGPPQPFRKGGHVQVPRGSGCATKGKRFRGIY